MGGIVEQTFWKHAWIKQAILVLGFLPEYALKSPQVMQAKEDTVETCPAGTSDNSWYVYTGGEGT